MTQIATRPLAPHFTYRLVELECLCPGHSDADDGGGGGALLGAEATVGFECEGTRAAVFAVKAGSGGLACTFCAAGGFTGRRKGGLGGIEGKRSVGGQAYGSQTMAHPLRLFLLALHSDYAGHISTRVQIVPQRRAQKKKAQKVLVNVRISRGIGVYLAKWQLYSTGTSTYPDMQWLPFGHVHAHQIHNPVIYLSALMTASAYS